MEMLNSDMLGKILSNDSEDRMDCPMPKTEFPAETPLAMAYVPFQVWEEPYDSDTALSRGTVFPSLDKPFIGEEAVRNAHTK